MVSRRKLLKFYDNVHKNSVRVLWACGLGAGVLIFIRVCEILYFPQKPRLLEEEPDFKKIVSQLNENPEMLKED
ncbi:hypothetical protein PGB90_003432 [Kerria lacca]